MLARLHIAARDTGRRLVLALLHAFRFFLSMRFLLTQLAGFESLAQITDCPLSGESGFLFKSVARRRPEHFSRRASRELRRRRGRSRAPLPPTREITREALR